MSKAYLTIDDSPTRITPDLVDYLRGKGIVPELNFIGQSVERRCDEAVYAVKNGAIIGNHSFSHEHFSELSLDECRRDIARAEELLNDVYARAGVARQHRFFRFPYGDHGGANAAALQRMLREEFKFDCLDDSLIRFPWWRENHLGTNVDMFWTFDFEEYRLPWHDGWTWDSIVRRVSDAAPKMGGALLGDNAVNIVLMHNHEETDAFLPRYYQKLIDYVISLGVEFIPPKFIAWNAGRCGHRPLQNDEMRTRNGSAHDGNSARTGGSGSPP